MNRDLAKGDFLRRCDTLLSYQARLYSIVNSRNPFRQTTDCIIMLNGPLTRWKCNNSEKFLPMSACAVRAGWQGTILLAKVLSHLFIEYSSCIYRSIKDSFFTFVDNRLNKEVDLSLYKQKTKIKALKTLMCQESQYKELIPVIYNDKQWYMKNKPWRTRQMTN